MFLLRFLLPVVATAFVISDECKEAQFDPSTQSVTGLGMQDAIKLGPESLREGKICEALQECIGKKQSRLECMAEAQTARRLFTSHKAETGQSFFIARVNAILRSAQASESEENDRQPVFFFDVDDTLYPRSKGIYDMFTTAFESFITKHADGKKVEREQAARYFYEYGSTMVGMILHHGIDPKEMDHLSSEHVILDSLEEDHELLEMLTKMGQKFKLWLLTNGTEKHAKAVLEALGLDKLFQDALTFCDLTQVSAGFRCKPNEYIYKKAMEDAKVKDKDVRLCYFIDDSQRNIDSALAQGWTAVHIVEGSEFAEDQQGPFYTIGSIDQLPLLFDKSST